MAEKKTARKATKPAKRSAKTTVRKTAGRLAARSAPSDARAGASERITRRIEELGDWRGEKLALVRRLIHEADPGIVEEWKWDLPVWSHDGIVCTGETYKQVVKLTFAKGAFLADPRGLFNAGLTGNVRRAIDIRAEDDVGGPAFRALIREAVALNQGRSAGRGRPSRGGSRGR